MRSRSIFAKYITGIALSVSISLVFAGTQIDLTSQVKGVLPVANGGTGTVSGVPAGTLQSSNNLSDVASSVVARSNLGLGSAATMNSSAFDPAGSASSVAVGSFTGSLSGDVTGTQTSTSVVKVNGLSIPTSASLVGTNSSGQIVANTSTITNNTTGNAATATSATSATTATNVSNGTASNMSYVDTSSTPVAIGSGNVWRGIGQGMNSTVGGFSSGNNISSTLRSRHYAQVKFRRVRAVIQVFYPTGTPIVDTLFTNAYNFQVGFEYPFTNALSGLSPRKLFTWNGSETVSYNPFSPPASGYLISDVLDLGTYYTPGTISSPSFFGIHTTVESPTQVTGIMPYQRNSSSFLNRYEGTIATSTIASSTSCSIGGTGNLVLTLAGTSTNFAVNQLITGSGIAANTHIVSLGTGGGGNGTYNLDTASTGVSAISCTGVLSNITADTARSSTTYTAVSSAMGGTSSFFTPVMLLIETDAATPFVSIIGDSIAYGVG